MYHGRRYVLLAFSTLTAMTGGKYPRTYHFPFSPGTSSDDRICHDWQGLLDHPLVITEKLDGENSCLKATGAYARSHGSPTRNPWAQNLWAIWERVHQYLGELEIFGENLYAIHSIEYHPLPTHFFVFAMREGDQWLSWEDVCFFAGVLDLPTVPVVAQGTFDEDRLRAVIDAHMSRGSLLGAGPTEGVVTRVAGAFSSDVFSTHLLKYVRAHHVTTDAHWTRNWRRAPLAWEYPDAESDT
jgi:hypothetical protein